VFDRPSNVEINALCQGKENWIVEFEYRDKLVTEKNLKVLNALLRQYGMHRVDEV